MGLTLSTVDTLHTLRSRELTNYLVVGLNTNEWLKDKKGQYFQDWKERAEIIRHLEMVDAVITVPYDEKGSAYVEPLRLVWELHRQ